MPKEIAMSRQTHVEVLFERHSDGRYYVHSPNLPGLHLAGEDIDTIRKDLKTIMKDLFWHNLNLIIDEIQFVPDLENIVRELKGLPPEPSGSETYVVTLKEAA